MLLVNILDRFDKEATEFTASQIYCFTNFKFAGYHFYATRSHSELRQKAEKFLENR